MSKKDSKPMTAKEFRAELIKIMPGYKWTVHKGYGDTHLKATGIQSAGFNRISTLSVNRREQKGHVLYPIEYEVKSSGYGLRAPWLSTYKDGTLARALRGLQEHYEYAAQNYRAHAIALQDGRNKEQVQANPAS